MHETNDVGASDTSELQEARPRRRRFRLQWSLQTLLLLTAAVAVWVAYVRLRQQIPRLEQEIDSLGQMARELIVEDEEQIAVVMLPPMWYGESRWEIYLPEGEYVMRLGTRQIDDQLTSLVLGPDKERFPPAVGETPIGAGHHRIELMRSEEWRGREITVLLDDRPVIEAEEEPDWNTGGTSTGASEIGDCVQRPAHEPLVLYRRRFYLRQKGGQYVAPKGPAKGLMLWIEPVEVD